MKPSPLDGLSTGARRLARQVRRPGTGRLDIRATAERLNVRLAFVSALDARGLALGVDEILLDGQLVEGEARVVFAHEVGHILARRGALPGVSDDERRADQFGDELALPSASVQRHSALGIVAVAELFAVPPSRAAAQFARIGLIPPLTRLSSGDVICARCGDRRSVTCDCLYYRVNGHKAGRLPLAS